MDFDLTDYFGVGVDALTDWVGLTDGAALGSAADLVGKQEDFDPENLKLLLEVGNDATDGGLETEIVKQAAKDAADSAAAALWPWWAPWAIGAAAVVTVAVLAAPYVAPLLIARKAAA